MMLRLGARRSAGLALAAAALFWFASPASAQQNCNDCFRCQSHHCPPALKHCMEGAPRVHFRHGCPLPVCSPCTQPGWGYYQPCWTPYPFPPDFNHCPVQPPAAVVFPGLMQPNNGATGVNESLPFPRRTQPGI